MKYTYILVLLVLSFATSYAQRSGAEFCYPDGCVNLTNERGRVGGVASNYSSLESYLDYVFSYYSAHGATVSTRDSSNRFLTISCNNGASVTVTRATSTCSNGANNPTACNICPSGSTMTNGQCVCTNGATGIQCNICPSGLVMQNNLCVCSNGATNPNSCNTCPAGSTLVGGQCTCNNGADVLAQCNNCRTGQAFDNNGQCKDSCTTTNVCGQTAQGFMNNGVCTLSTVNGADPNSSCIIDFNVTTNTVNPNGSIEFSWKLANLPPTIGSRCGFVDLTTPTPRPIPGLQNLSPQTDRVRINNVQATTRFCLVCQYYTLLNNTDLGEAAKHQWVRVIRVGEN